MAVTLYELALKAIRSVFSNPGTQPAETREDLEGLRDEINTLIASLPPGTIDEFEDTAADMDGNADEEDDIPF